MAVEWPKELLIEQALRAARTVCDRFENGRATAADPEVESVTGGAASGTVPAADIRALRAALDRIEK